MPGERKVKKVSRLPLVLHATMAKAELKSTKDDKFFLAWQKRIGREYRKASKASERIVLKVATEKISFSRLGKTEEIEKKKTSVNSTGLVGHCDGEDRTEKKTHLWGIPPLF